MSTQRERDIAKIVLVSIETLKEAMIAIEREYPADPLRQYAALKGAVNGVCRGALEAVNSATGAAYMMPGGK